MFRARTPDGSDHKCRKTRLRQAGCVRGSVVENLTRSTGRKGLPGIGARLSCADPKSDVKVSRPVFFNDGKFLATPLEAGLVLAGTAE